MSLRNSYLQSLLHETEEKLRQTSLELSELRAGIDDAVIVSMSNARGEITHVNPMMVKISGYQPWELVGKPHKIFNSDFHSHAFFRNLWDTILRGEIWKGEIRNKTKGGGLFWVDATIVPFLNEDHEVYQFMSIWHEITERKAEAQRASEERAVREYVGRLAAVGEITSDIAHEIRNPLSAVLLRIQMSLRQPNIAGPMRHTLSEIEALIHRMEKIIDGVSLFSRDSSDEPFVPLSVMKLVRSTLDLMHEKLEKLEIHVTIEGPGENLMVRGRPSQLAQVLLNLVNNAADAIAKEPEKWIRIEVEESRDSATLRVIDSGPGIPIEMRDKIMEPYFSTKPIGQGTGLGLSVSNQILLAHSGKLRLETEKEHTSFAMSLPVYD